MSKTARQVSFTIIVLAAISFQLGWFERERSKRQAVYSYIEKVLTITDALQSGLKTATINQVSLTAKTPPIRTLTDGVENPAAVFVRSMADLKFEEVKLAVGFDQLKTLGDPGGDCTVRLFRGSGPSVHGIEKINSLSTAQRYSETIGARNASTYLVLFGRACLYLMGDIKPVLIVYAPDDPKFTSPSAVISPRVAETVQLPLDSKSYSNGERATHEDLYSPQTLQSLTELTRITRPAYTEEVLKAAISREAMRIGGAPFELKDWRKAIAKIYERSAQAPSILGFSLPVEMAAFLLPVVLSPVAFAFLFHAKRIRTISEDEIWVLTHSEGAFEHFGAGLWYAALIAAPVVTMWGLSSFAPRQLESMYHSLGIVTFMSDPIGAESRLSNIASISSSPAFWALLATATSTIMIGRALVLLIVLRKRSRTKKPVARFRVPNRTDRIRKR